MGFSQFKGGMVNMVLTNVARTLRGANDKSKNPENVYITMRFE
jgi:hypothetical protein